MIKLITSVLLFIGSLLHPAQVLPPADNVLGDTAGETVFTVNVPALFTREIQAPNVVYSLSPGGGISVSGSQSAILTNTGVLSLQGKTGDLTFLAGTGITLDGLTITNSDPGSAQKIFRTIKVSGGTDITAGSNTDSLTFAGSGAISIQTDGNKLTITSSTPNYSGSGWTDTGSAVVLTTSTDSVGIGTQNPTAKLDVAGNGKISGTLSAGALTVTGTASLSGSITFGDALTDALTFTGGMADGTALVPDTDLGSDLGSSGLRFDNLWVANLISNNRQTFSGQSVFSYAPLDSTITQASVLINPTTAAANGQLLGLGVNGYEHAVFDRDGDIILGYNDAESAPYSEIPFTVYGHNGTVVASVDTSGNTYLLGNLDVNGTANDIAGTLNLSGNTLTSAGALSIGNGASITGTLAVNGTQLSVNGNVGIGTASPDSKLTVTGAQTGKALVTFAQSGSGNILTASSAGTTADVLDTSGNLGIGTTAPTAKVDIDAATGTDALRLTATSGKVLGISTGTNALAMDISSTGSVNKLTNGGFDTDLTGWQGTQRYALDDEFTDTLPATLATGTPTTLQSGGVINPTPIAGADVVTNGNMETGDPPSNWTALAGSTKSRSTDAHGGSASINLTTNPDASGEMWQAQNMTEGTWYVMSAWAKKNYNAQPAGWGLPYIYLQRNEVPWTSYPGVNFSNDGNWDQGIRTLRALGSSLYTSPRNSWSTTGTSNLFDDISLKPLTLSSLFSTVSVTTTSDYSVQADVTLFTGAQGGVVLNLDSDTNPQNFVIAYTDGTKAYLDKNVGGTYAGLISENVSYSAGRTIKVIRNGTSYSLYYNGTQVGNSQSITDAGIINNTRHGVFSTYASNSFVNFLVQGGVYNPNPTLGSELTSNGNFSDTSWWQLGTNTSISGGTANLNAESGSALYKWNLLTIGTWYSTTFDILNYSSGRIYVTLGDFISSVAKNTNGTFTLVNRDNQNATFQLIPNGLSSTLSIDNVSVKPLTLSSLFSTTTVAASSDHTVQADVTMTAGTQAGVVLNIDSSTAPSKFVIGYINGSQACLDKNVSGTYTAVIACTNISYVAGQTLKVIQNNTSYSLFYNGVQVGTTQAVADIPVSNIQGVFSTYASNSFANFTVKGGVNGTLATDGLNTRTATDALSQISLSAGNVSFSDQNNQPTLAYSALTRATGKVISSQLNTSNSNGGFKIGSSTEFFYGVGSDLQIRTSGWLSVGAFSINTPYQLATIAKTNGSYYFIKGGSYTNWSLLNIYPVGNSTITPQYTAGGNNRAYTSDYMRVPSSIYLPSPLAYDTFNRADGVIGNSETIGPDGQTSPQLSWTGGSINGSKLVINPTLGNEILSNPGLEAPYTSGIANGWNSEGTNLTEENIIVHSGSSSQKTTGGDAAGISQPITNKQTIGTWYQASAWFYNIPNGAKDFFVYDDYTNGHISPQSLTTNSWLQYFLSYRALGTGLYIKADRYYSGSSGYFDDISLKQLDLSSLFATVATSTKDIVEDVSIKLTPGTQAGVASNLNSNRTAGIVAYLSYPTSPSTSKVTLEKFTDVNSWSIVLAPTTVTYADDATLRIITYHSDANTLKVRVYYNNLLVGSEQTITDASIINNTIHGLFSTYSGNTFDNFSLFARGSDNEYALITPADLTVTRDTGVTYASNGPSAKLIAGATDNDFTTTANVGDTSSYTMSAYAYTNGSAVTASDLSLYYDTGPITTAYSPLGSTGWYKLSGTLTGAAASKVYGVRVKAGKTVYVDNINLSGGTTGTSTMYIANAGTGRSNLNVQGLIDGTTGGVATFTKAGPVSDADFATTADGLLGIDTLNHRIYFRENGSWSYIAKNGGFQIPKEEASGLDVGDLLVPYIESKLSDGALHGQFRNLSEAITGGKAVIQENTDHIDIRFARPFARKPVVAISLTSSSSSGFLSEGGRALVKNITPEGFSIVLEATASAVHEYFWRALNL